jgi:hypothetical protein
VVNCECTTETGKIRTCSNIYCLAPILPQIPPDGPLPERGTRIPLAEITPESHLEHCCIIEVDLEDIEETVVEDRKQNFREVNFTLRHDQDLVNFRDLINVDIYPLLPIFGTPLKLLEITIRIHILESTAYYYKAKKGLPVKRNLNKTANAYYKATLHIPTVKDVV